MMRHMKRRDDFLYIYVHDSSFKKAKHAHKSSLIFIIYSLLFFQFKFSQFMCLSNQCLKIILLI